MKREFMFKYKTNSYLIRVYPDIAARGGESGAGTWTCVNPVNPGSGKALPVMRGFQGGYSEARLIQLIRKAFLFNHKLE